MQLRNVLQAIRRLLAGPPAPQAPPPAAASQVPQASVVAVGPAEVSMKHRRQAELAQLGFIALLNEGRAADRALIIFDTPSLARPRGSAERSVAGDQRAAIALPFIMATSRFMHYARLIERDASLAGEDGAQVEGRLSRWLARYVAREDAPAEARAGRPLRAGWARVTAQPDGGKDIVQVFLQPCLGDGEVAHPTRFQFPRTAPIAARPARLPD